MSKHTSFARLLGGLGFLVAGGAGWLGCWAPASPGPAAPGSAAPAWARFTRQTTYLIERSGGALEQIGERLVHAPTGFTVDLLRVGPVPQASIWVEAPSRSDRGEAHALEHLVLDRGDAGRRRSTLTPLLL